MPYIIDDQAMHRAALHYGEVLIRHHGDADAILEEERIDSHSLGHLLGELHEKRGYKDDQDMRDASFEAFVLGVAAGRRESFADDDGLGVDFKDML